MMMRYLMIDDPHIFRDNRVQVQLMFVFLLIADSGERIGAIVSLISYPGDEVVLCYKVCERCCYSKSLVNLYL